MELIKKDDALFYEIGKMNLIESYLYRYLFSWFIKRFEKKYKMYEETFNQYKKLNNNGTI